MNGMEVVAKQIGLPHPSTVFFPHKDISARQIEWVRKWKISQSFHFDLCFDVFNIPCIIP